MKKVSVTVADENAFFARGRRLAALADAGKPIPSESVISFGDPADLLKMLTPARLALMSAVKAQPVAADQHRFGAAAQSNTVHPPRLRSLPTTGIAARGINAIRYQSRGSRIGRHSA